MSLFIGIYYLGLELIFILFHKAVKGVQYFLTEEEKEKLMSYIEQKVEEHHGIVKANHIAKEERKFQHKLVDLLFWVSLLD